MRSFSAKVLMRYIMVVIDCGIDDNVSCDQWELMIMGLEEKLDRAITRNVISKETKEAILQCICNSTKETIKSDKEKIEKLV